jgi:pimeloyl-ACP methyl ester carboxylesterase
MKTQRKRIGRTWSALAVVLTTLGCAPPGPRLPADHIDALRKTIHVGPPLDAEIGYLAAGDPQGMRVILVHGTPGSAEGWADYLLKPPPGLEVLALDRPGFGRSGPEGAVTRLAAQAAAVAALLPADGRPAVLLGHSLGGPIVARVAVDHPDRVAALVLLAASLDPALEEIHPMQPLGTWWPVRQLLPRAIRNANAELMALRPELVQLAGLLAQVTAPVIIVHGTADQLVPVANVAFMQAHLRATRCRETLLLEGSNHFLPWNAEATVRSAIAWAAGQPC